MSLVDKYFGTSLPLISKLLCVKAAQQNADLTQVERWLFLSHGTEYGQFLADPKSVNEEQLSSILGRPPPKVIEWNVKTTIGLGSIPEVLERYWNPDRTDELSYEGLQCITLNWWTHFTSDIYSPCPADINEAIVDAANELAVKINPEQSAFQQAVVHAYFDRQDETEKRDVNEEQKGNKSRVDWWDISNDWRTEYLASAEELRKRLRTQVNEELASATDTDLEAVRELQQRMITETAEEEQAERALKLERKSQRTRRARKKTRAARAEGESGDDEDDSGGESGTEGSEEYIMKSYTRDYKKHPVTREEVEAEEKAQAELEIMRQEGEASGWSWETNPYR